MTTGRQERWAGNFPAYALERWGGRLPRGDLRVLLLSSAAPGRLLDWLATLPLSELAYLPVGPEAATPDAPPFPVTQVDWEGLVDGYHLVVSVGALSRQPDLEERLERLGRALAPGGLLLLRDYTGPAHFQFSPAQLGVVNSLLALLPEKRRRDITGLRRERQGSPDLAWLMANDHRAAVRSEDLRAEVATTFAILEEADLGGTVLMPLLTGISQNFYYPSPECQAELVVLWNVERTLIEAGWLPSDHWFAVAERRRNAAVPSGEGVFIERESL
jgi:SAM-dependent methyltransferase